MGRKCPLNQWFPNLNVSQDHLERPALVQVVWVCRATKLAGDAYEAASAGTPLTPTMDTGTWTTQAMQAQDKFHYNSHLYL